MSLRTLPILFLNLGGEMLNILDQRLRAQSVLPDKATKVLLDIAAHMLDERCIAETFRPQKVFTRRSLRTVFERLAHASIMKLNASAMEKLYDLMLMAVKYQILMCQRPEDVILVTLNHLDMIRQYVSSSRKHVAIVNRTCRTLTDFYSRITPAQYIQLRCTLLIVFQDSHKRVSIFLKNKAQRADGWFVIPVGGRVPHGFEIPGTIRYYDDHVVTTDHFTLQQQFEEAAPAGSWEVEGDRVIDLGKNIYVTDRSTEPAVSGGTHAQIEEEHEERPAGSAAPLIVAELQLLKTLMGMKANSAGPQDTFKLKLFDDDEDLGLAGLQAGANVVQIDPTKKGNSELSKIMQDFYVKEPSEGDGVREEDDILDLMDHAA